MRQQFRLSLSSTRKLAQVAMARYFDTHSFNIVMSISMAHYRGLEGLLKLVFWLLHN